MCIYKLIEMKLINDVSYHKLMKYNIVNRTEIDIM